MGFYAQGQPVSGQAQNQAGCRKLGQPAHIKTLHYVRLQIRTRA